MATIANTGHAAQTAIPRRHPLSGGPSKWPDAAHDAYRSVLVALDSWCRGNNASQQLNPWVAEEAVRQSW